MPPTIVPDGFVGGYDVLIAALANMLRVPVEHVNHFVTLTELLGPEDGWHVTVCCDITTEHLPCLLRAMADQVEAHARARQS